MTSTLTQLSASISHLVTSAARMVSAIRIAPDRHITGLVCEGDTIVTIAQALPVQERYMVGLSHRLPIAARPGPRDPGVNLAVLRLDTPWPALNPEIASTAVGNLVLVVGADDDASPTVRLTVIHRFNRTADGPVPVLDLPAASVDQGGAVLDLDGRLIGLATLGPNGEAVAIPSAMIGRLLMPDMTAPTGAQPPPFQSPPPQWPPAQSPPPQSPVPLPDTPRRGWLGVALQPITVPDKLVPKAGQASGRMVVSITKGGPAEMAGMRVGDVLLALDGTSASGPQALRAFLGGDRVGTNVEVKLLREGNIVTTNLIIAVQPG